MLVCHQCGSNKTESDAASGTTFCMACGEVLEENTIVSEVQFGETSGGRAVLQGSYAGESGRISGGGLFGRGRREGQEQSFENGRQNIASIAHGIRLPERYRETAQRYYNLAVVNKFTKGRRVEMVAAVCLYCVCRAEKSSHMLIDFSDLLGVNVFALGGVFLKLCRTLNLKLPYVDPSIYISRFAAALDFGSYTHRVAQDAVRIAQRMDRDWIQTGRRPAGICGACLLMAARMNGFRRTTEEIIYIVKVGEATIEKRLQEFKQTESAQLSARDFRTVWLEQTADPPAFIENRKKEAEARLLLENTAEETTAAPSTSSADDPPHPDAAPKKAELKVMLEEEAPVEPILKRSIRALIDPEESQPKKPKTQEELEEDLMALKMDEALTKEIMAVIQNKEDLIECTQQDTLPEHKTEDGTLEEEDTLVDTLVEEDTLVDTLVEEDTLVQTHPDVIPLKSKYFQSLPLEKQIELTQRAKAAVAKEAAASLSTEMEGDVLVINNEIEEWLHNESIQVATQQVEDIHREAHDLLELKEESLSDVDDEEVEAMILTPDEVMLKTQVWYNSNKEYLETMAVRRLVQKEKVNRPRDKRKKQPPATTPAEAAKQLMATHKISSKINHSVFDDIFETPESIERIKAEDEVRSTLESMAVPVYEVVEESGKAVTEEKESSDDEDMDSDDMDEEEKLMRNMREQFYQSEEENFEDYE